MAQIVNDIDYELNNDLTDETLLLDDDEYFVENKKIINNNIFYIKNIATKQYKTISREEFIKTASSDSLRKINGCFNEIITKDTPYVHLYFDFDSLTTLEDYNAIISYCKLIGININSEISICGYTTDRTIAKNTGLHLINIDKTTKGGYEVLPPKHVISVHVVYYESCVRCEDLEKFMNEAKGKIDKNIDPAVYKLTSRQCFRHGLSNKIIKNSITITRGKILDNKEPITQIITATGEEQSFLSYNDLFKAFGIEATEPKVEKKDKQAVSTKTDSSLLTKEELLELFEKVYANACNDNLMNVIGIMCSSPYEEEFIADVIREWYDSYEHTTPNTDFERLISKRYEQTMSNDWLFKLISKLSDAEKTAYLTKYNLNSIDKEYIEAMEKLAPETQEKTTEQTTTPQLNINTGSICYDDLIRKTYDNVESLLVDLKQIIGFVKNRYFVKERYEDSEQFIVQEYKKESFNDMFNKIKPFKGNSEKTVYDIIKKFSNLFIYRDYFMYDPKTASSSKIENIINIFQGYKYKEVITNDFSILQPLLTHIKDIICDGDEKKYEYLMYWFANIIKNLTVKNGTIPIIHGGQSSGKSMVMDIFAELLGDMALGNVDDLDKVFGRFNKLNENKILIVLNEIPESSDKHKVADKMKSRITETKTLIEGKGVDSRPSKSYANYIITSNHPNPIPTEKGDRRKIYYATNNEHVHDIDYFDYIHKDFQPIKQGPYNKQYMGILLHYMLTQFPNPERFNFERLIIESMSDTTAECNEYLERQYNGLSLPHKFVVDNYKMFLLGFPIDNISIDKYNSKSIGIALRNICDNKRVRVNSKEAEDIYNEFIKENIPAQYCSQIYNKDSSSQKRFYKLKDKQYIKDIWNIIEYKMNQEKLYGEPSTNNNDTELQGYDEE